jgi:tetratricopeptide (TPR) repeat protein
MRCAGIFIVVTVGLAGVVSAQDLAVRLEEASIRYDAAAAVAVLAEAVDAAKLEPSTDHVLLVAKAALLAAELRRIEWERLPESDSAQHRSLGSAIDEAAEDGLRALESLSPDSEVHRLKADLLAVMIRSDYRAKKYRADMEDAATRAVELDPANARAYVSQAKPYVFAESHEGGDPEKAISLLSKALELDPGLESARCLRGLAYEKAGEIEKARGDWALALEKNPHCRPAKEELARLDAE